MWANLNQNDLILHHVIPVGIEYIFEADLDNLVFVCFDCHIEIHQKDGCKIQDIKNYCI